MYEREVERHDKRRKVFIREGLSEISATDLADQMYDRDQDSSDDRRVCFECTHLDGWYCNSIKVAGKRLEPLRFILQRCDNFNLKGATHVAT